MTMTSGEQEALASMLADDTPDPRPGRPPIMLYPGVAAQVLHELEVVGRSYRADTFLLTNAEVCCNAP